jgi:hypothetical protein
MSDNKNERAPRDAQRINLQEDYEVRYWTKALNTTKEALEATVKKVGVMVTDVRRELGKTAKAS